MKFAKRSWLRKEILEKRITNLAKLASSVPPQMRGEREEIRDRSLGEMCITPTGNRAPETPVSDDPGSRAKFPGDVCPRTDSAARDADVDDGINTGP